MAPSTEPRATEDSSPRNGKDVFPAKQDKLNRAKYQRSEKLNGSTKTFRSRCLKEILVYHTYAILK